MNESRPNGKIQESTEEWNAADLQNKYSYLTFSFKSAINGAKGWRSLIPLHNSHAWSLVDKCIERDLGGKRINISRLKCIKSNMKKSSSLFWNDTRLSSKKVLINIYKLVLMEPLKPIGMAKQALKKHNHVISTSYSLHLLHELMLNYFNRYSLASHGS